MTSRVKKPNSLLRLAAFFKARNPLVVELFQARTEKTFLRAVENGLEGAIREIEGGAKHYSALDERGLSRLLAGLLNAAGFRASAESDHNGHVDVLIEEEQIGHWKYLGECKLYAGFKYHVAGCEQLLGYCSGREQRAFSLDFFKKPAMFEKLKALRKRFDKEKPAGQDGGSSEHKIRGAFITKHAHSSGRSVELLHLGCTVWA